MAQRRWNGVGGWRLPVAVALLAALAACGGVRIRAHEAVPVPLVDELPLRAGVHYSPEFRAYTAHEDRWQTKWEIALGAAHVAQIDRLLKPMFATVTEVADLAKPPQPPLDLILEPRFEEYSFLTPRDAGSDLFAVTIKYRINVYDGAGQLIDSLVLTGYGNELAGQLSSEKPLAAATQKAMRDAGAKFAAEFPDQPVVGKLVRHEPVATIANAAGATPVPGTIAEVTPPSDPPPAPKAVPPPAAAAGPPAPELAPLLPPEPPPPPPPLETPG